ncbi:MAG: HEAT repeat domain-containing protein [Pirellulaceae bacterium]
MPLTICWLLLSGTTLAQNNPFEDPSQDQSPFNTASPFDDPAPEVAPAPAPDPAAGADTGDEEAGLIAPLDNTTAGIVNSSPQTPEAIVRVIGMLMNLDRDDLARPFVDQVSAMELSNEQLLQLYRDAGPDAIFRIGVRPGIQPAGAALARRIVDGAEAWANDAQRIGELVRQVTNDDIYERTRALEDLKLIGDIGAAALIEALVDPQFEANWPRIRQAVSRFGDSAEGPLLAAWRSNSLKLQVEALYLLRNVRTPDSIETLMAPLLSSASTSLQRQVASDSLQIISGRVPDQQEIESRLLRSAREYLMDQVVLNRDANDLVKWWRWDPDSRTMVPSWLTSRTVARIRGFRRAKDLIELNPGREEYQRLYWLARMESAKLTSGLQQPMPDVVVNSFAGTMEPEMALAVLDDALRMGRVPAAIAATEVLGVMGEKWFLDSQGGTPSPLIRALDFGSIRLLQSATRAIHQIDPDRAFAGSSKYLDTLVFLSRSTGVPTALVGHVNPEQARTLAALVGRSGFFASGVSTSREMFDRASQDPDLQLLVITDKLNRANFSELVQAFRASARTRRVPILLMVDPHNLARAERLAERFPNVLVSPIITDGVLIARQIENLRQGTTYRDATQGERNSYAVDALQYLGEYARQADKYPYFDLTAHQDQLMRALGSPAAAADTLRLLGEIGTPQAQSRLVNTASNIQLPAPLRKIAAESFAHAVRTHGLMLRNDDIQTQYDRYNSSGSQPPETQQILGYLLDAIEKRLN